MTAETILQHNEAIKSSHNSFQPADLGQKTPDEVESNYEAAYKNYYANIQ